MLQVDHVNIKSYAMRMSTLTLQVDHVKNKFIAKMAIILMNLVILAKQMILANQGKFLIHFTNLVKF